MKSKNYKEERPCRNSVFYALLFLVSFSHAQVGIRNNDPKATLDITASNQATPSNEDGILIPRVDAFPGTDPTAAQDGMLVYLTTTVGTNAKGFYYWDNTTTAWNGVGSVQKVNDLSDAKSDVDGTDDGSSVFIGIDAGVADDGDNNENVGVGYQALMTNINSNANTAFGYQALRLNTSLNNAAFGNRALGSNTTGRRNTALGRGALESNSTSNNSTAVGAFAGGSSTGSDNTFLGYQSGQNSGGGEDNVYLGRNSGRNTTGSSNIFIGDNAGNTSFNGVSNTLVIENSNSSTPLVYGDFDTNRVGIDKLASTHTLEVNGTTEATQFKLSALNTAPASATDTGVVGEIRVTATHIYVCIATDTWVRAALATWP